MSRRSTWVARRSTRSLRRAISPRDSRRGGKTIDSHRGRGVDAALKCLKFQTRVERVLDVLAAESAVNRACTARNKNVRVNCRGDDAIHRQHEFGSRERRWSRTKSIDWTKRFFVLCSGQIGRVLQSYLDWWQVWHTRTYFQAIRAEKQGDVWMMWAKEPEEARETRESHLLKGLTQL